jgi:N-acetyl-anhydromuramyl-L-alanine amidase AmpD
MKQLSSFITKHFGSIFLSVLALNLVASFFVFFDNEDKTSNKSKVSIPNNTILSNKINEPLDNKANIIQKKIKSLTSIQASKSRLDSPHIFKNASAVETNDADPSNYGNRLTYDLHGKHLNNKLLFVLHETVISADQTIKKFKTFHQKDQDQVSYHALIRQDGRLVIMVPYEKRAYGAGDSSFMGESVQTNPQIKPSVNNFSYHIALETPLDGNNENQTHSGYTDMQYQSFAFVVSNYVKANKLSLSRITTHKEIDLSKTRTDPRSFDYDKFNNLVKSYLKK